MEFNFNTQPEPTRNFAPPQNNTYVPQNNTFSSQNNTYAPQNNPYTPQNNQKDNFKLGSGLHDSRFYNFDTPDNNKF